MGTVLFYWLWPTWVQSCLTGYGLHEYSLVWLVVAYMGSVLFNWLWPTWVQSCLTGCGLHGFSLGCGLQGYSLVWLVVVYMGTVLFNWLWSTWVQSCFWLVCLIEMFVLHFCCFQVYFCLFCCFYIRCTLSNPNCPVPKGNRWFVQITESVIVGTIDY